MGCTFFAIIWHFLLMPKFMFVLKIFFVPDSSAGKESTCNAGDLGLILGLGRSPGEGNGYPLQYSGLENSMDCIVRGVTKSQTRLRYFHLNNFSSFNVTLYFQCLQNLLLTTNSAIPSSLR